MKYSAVVFLLAAIPDGVDKGHDMNLDMCDVDACLSPLGMDFVDGYSFN